VRLFKRVRRGAKFAAGAVNRPWQPAPEPASAARAAVHDTDCEAEDAVRPCLLGCTRALSLHVRERLPMTDARVMCDANTSRTDSAFTLGCVN